MNEFILNCINHKVTIRLSINIVEALRHYNSVSKFQLVNVIVVLRLPLIKSIIVMRKTKVLFGVAGCNVVVVDF